MSSPSKSSKWSILRSDFFRYSIAAVLFISVLAVVVLTCVLIVQVHQAVHAHIEKCAHIEEMRAQRTLKPEMKEVLLEVDGSVVELQVGVVVVDGVRYQVVSQPRTKNCSSITTLQILPP